MRKKKRSDALIVSATLVLLAALGLYSCTSTEPIDVATEASYTEGVPGGIVVTAYQTTVRVKRIDQARRTATLILPDGSTTDFEAGPEAVNFDQIEAGDRLQVTLMEEVVAYLREEGTPSQDGAALIMALAPKGAKPGGFVADTVEVTAKVRDVDLKRHEATLLFPDGDIKTFVVRPDVELSQAHIGREVVIHVTKILAIATEPSS
jgi:hypothetical protein